MNEHTRLATLLALAALALPASAKTYYVNAATGSDANTGLSQAKAFKTLQKAVNKAAAGSTILVYPGTYEVGDSKGKKVTVKSVDGTEDTFIEPSYVATDWSSWSGYQYDDAIELGKWGTQRVFASGHWRIKGRQRIGTSTKLEGFTLSGPIQCGTVSHCTISGVDQGIDTDGDVYGRPVLVQGAKVLDSRIENCGGDSLAYNTTFARCGIVGNQFGYGIADLCTFNNCLVAGNKVTHSDGAIGKKTGYITKLYNTTVVGNTVYTGYSDEGAVVGPNCDVYNCIIFGNRDTHGNEANIEFATDGKTGETVAFQFMGRYVQSGSKYRFYQASRTMKNTLVEEFVVVQKGNKKATGNISGDPCFIDPANGDYHLAPWSPCVNAGADYTKKTGKFDLDSAARKVGKVDMGAYEMPAQVAAPADYDGDGLTDPAFFFGPTGQWWIFQGADHSELKTVALPDRNGTPCPADYDGNGSAEIAYFTAAAKTPEFVQVAADGTELERTAFGVKGATPVAARLSTGATATFGTYTANAKKPEFSFKNGKKVVYGAKASRPVAADFDGDGKDDLGVYTATASKPAFSILQSSKSFSTAKLFNDGPVALGAKGAIPCVADFDGDGKADFATYQSNAKAPYFSRLFSTAKFKETRTLPMGSKGDAPVVGVYETAHGPAAPAVWTGLAWTYYDSVWNLENVLDE